MQTISIQYNKSTKDVFLPIYEKMKDKYLPQFDHRNTTNTYTHVAVALTKQIGAWAGQPDLEQGRTFFGVPTSTSESVSDVTFRLPLGRPDFLKLA